MLVFHSQVWSLTEGSCLMTLTGHHDAVTCLNLTFDSRKVISGSLDHNLKFWDLLTGKVIKWSQRSQFTCVILRVSSLSLVNDVILFDIIFYLFIYFSALAHWIGSDLRVTLVL